VAASKTKKRKIKLLILNISFFYNCADEASPAMTPEKGNEKVSKCLINETALIVGG
jgi:hypothetical protein